MLSGLSSSIYADKIMIALDNLSHGFHKMGEFGGWCGATIGGIVACWAAITPDVVNQWVTMAFGLIMAGTGVGSAVYIRVTKARLEGRTLARIFDDNERAYLEGRPIPHPEFWPAPPEPTKIQ